MCCHILVVLVKIHDLLLHLLGLVWREAEFADVVCAVLVWVVVPKLRLHSVGAQDSVCSKRARQPPRHHIIS